MKTVLFTDESRPSRNDPDGLTKGWVFVFKEDNCAIMEMRRQQSGSVIMIWGGMIRNEVTGNKLLVTNYCEIYT